MVFDRRVHHRLLFALALAIASTSAACVLDWAALRTDGKTPPGQEAAVDDDADGKDGDDKDGGGDEKAPCSEDALVINEVQTGGPAGSADEFVEIFNPTSCDIRLEGFTLRYSSASGSTPFAQWTGAAEHGIGPGAYVVVGGSTYAGMALSRFEASTLAAPGGGIGLFNGGGKVIDSVAYGAINAGHPLVRPSTGKAAPAPPSGQSIARTPDGTDTETNETDFAIATSPTPNAKN